jgi:hypothetical protein
MTTSSIGNLAEDLRSILASFGSMLEGVYHIDEDLAAEMAEKFANRLREDTRTIYAEMTAEISEGLKKPPKKKRGRRKPVESSEVDDIDRRNIMGAEELPENDSTLLNLSNGGDPGQLAEQLLSSDKVTDRSGRPTMPTNSWDNDNPTMRRIR